MVLLTLTEHRAVVTITALSAPPLLFNVVVTASPAQLPGDLDAMRAWSLAERARHAEDIAAREAALARDVMI
jgi:hypothetical protein